MKKTLGWILVILVGFFCFDCAVCTSVAFTVDDATLAERIAVLVSCIALAAVNGLICWLGFKLKTSKGTTKPKPADQWMTSQLPALYLQKNKTVYRNQYIGRLESIGFKKEDAKKMFDFECEVVRKFPKQYLLQPQFTKMWFFGLNQPFFRQYPKTKEESLWIIQ